MRRVVTIICLAVAASLSAQQPWSAEEWCTQQDQNGDGKLNRDEASERPALKAGFEYFDINRDGGITQDEMKNAMAKWRQRQTENDEPSSTNAPPKRTTTTVPKKSTSKRPAAVDANSPQFRGPRGDGVAYGNNLPVTWSTTSNVVWSCTIPGKGWSSPIIWGDCVFVTSTVSPGSIEAPKELGSIMEHIRGQTTTDEHQYMLHCVDWHTGRLRWSRCVHKGVPPGSIHPKNTYASETPVTDGERVYAYFGNIGLFCYDMDGRELWSRKWGSFKMDWNWGTSASPALHGNLLFVLNDNQEKSFLVALDKRTGKDVWRVERDEKSNWTTPFVWQNNLRTEIVTSGSGKVRSYDLAGKLLWELRGMSGVTVPTPFAADGLLYIASGCQNSSLRPVYAIRPGATGDISLPADATFNTHIAWVQRRAAPYVTSPLVCDGQLYVLLDKGFLAAYDSLTGEEVYGKQRFTTGKAAFTASPWAYDGKIFCLTETGDTFVVDAGSEFSVLYVNRLDEAALSTPAIARDSLIIRTLTKLYRKANTSPTSEHTPTNREPQIPSNAAQQGFIPDAPIVGEVNGSYIDPEFNEVANQVVFQDVKNNVWIGDIDPITGKFKTTTGRDYLMDENIVVVFDRPPQGRKFSTNGPEWTCDDKGHLIVYTKQDSTGIMQQFSARLNRGKSVVTQLTHQQYDCYGNMPSRFQDGKPPRIAYTYGWPIWKAKAAWIFANKPDEWHNLDDFDYRQMSMWSAVSPDFLFVQRKEGAPHGQIARVNVNTGQVTVLTNDEGHKDDPGLFLAPEFGGEMLLVCNVGNHMLAIYRDEKHDGKSPWTRIMTLTLPPDVPHKFISSPETIASASGVGGISYFSLLARESKDRNTPGSIWVLGLGKDPANRFVRRVDDGSATGAPTVVLEPEPFVGRNEVFIYYNFFDRANGQHGLRRAATGIKVPAAHDTDKPASS